MKYYILILISLFLLSCNSNKEELEKLRNENAALRQVESEKNKYINEATLALNDIQDTLNSITSSIKLYEKGVETASPAVKQQIIEAIVKLKDELKSSKNKLTGLQEKLKASTVKIAGLEELVEKYKVLVSEKEAEIEKLNTNIAQLKETISERETQIAQKDIEIKKTVSERESKDEELNAFYYLSGTEGDLLDSKIIVKKGTWPLRTIYFTEQPDEVNFNRIDLRTKKEIIIKSVYDQDFGNIKILPDRNANTFSLEPIDDNSFKVVIKDTKAFAKISKYLVVVIE